MLVCDAPVTMAVVTVAVVTVAVGPACRQRADDRLSCALPSGLLGPSSPAGQYVCARPCAKAKSQHNRRWQWQQDMSEHGWRVCVTPAGIWESAGPCQLSHNHIQSGAHWAGSTFRSAWCSIQLYNDGGDGNRQVSTARRVSALQGGPCASQGRPGERRVLCRKEGRPAARPQSA